MARHLRRHGPDLNINDLEPAAQVDQVDGGLLLKPSPPPIRRKVYAMTKG